MKKLPARSTKLQSDKSKTPLEATTRKADTRAGERTKVLSWCRAVAKRIAERMRLVLFAALVVTSLGLP